MDEISVKNFKETRKLQTLLDCLAEGWFLNTHDIVLKSPRESLYNELQISE